MTLRPPARLVAAVVATIAALLATSVVAPAAEARRQPAPVISVANGTVGIAQTVSVLAPAQKNSTVTLQFSLNGTVLSQQPVALNGQGGGSLVMAPPASGTWTVSGVGSLAGATPVSVAVAPVTTRTVLAAANTAGLGIPTTMVVTVESTAGTYVPLGSVVFASPSGTTYGTASLVASGSGLSTATFSWTPSAVGTFPIVATYQPAAGLAGTPNATSSQGNDQIAVVTSLPLVTLRMPTAYTQGTPVTITALISDPNLNGSAAFLNNTNGVVTSVSGSIPIVSSMASTSWTPTNIGNQFITVQFSATNANTSGTDTQVIAVAPVGAPDPMSVSAAGIGVLRASSPSSAGTGQRIAITSTSGSGAAVNLAESGPCYLVGATLVTPTSPGSCVLTASSPGGGAYSPNTATFVISVTR